MFLMLENQVKKQSLIPADEYLANFLSKYSQNAAVNINETIEVKQRIYMII